MPIHLHIGTHKTGTTAIQRHLRRHRENLKHQGIWYPTEAELLPGGGDGIPHRNIVRSLDNTRGAKPYSRNDLEAMVSTMLSQSRHYDHTILSSEAFWRVGFAAAPDPYTTEELWLRKQSNVAKIRQLFGDADVRITAVLRERSAFIQSYYSEFILATLYTKNIKAFLRNYNYLWDYGRQLQAWANLFPVEAHSYEQLSQHNQLPLAFLRRLCGPHLCADSPTPDPRARVNISEPLACVAFKRFLNQLPLDYHKRKKLHHKYRRIFKQSVRQAEPKGIAQQLNTLNSWLEPGELRTLRRALAPGDDAIRANLCPDLVSAPSHRWCGLQSVHDQIRPMTNGSQRRMIDWMLSRKPLKQSWFHRETTLPAAAEP